MNNPKAVCDRDSSAAQIASTLRSAASAIEHGRHATYAK
jgi:hypothetical protein